MDINPIIQMGFYIKDLHFEIEQLHKKINFIDKKSTQKFVVYRGHGMKVKNELISFNSYSIRHANRRYEVYLELTNDNGKDLCKLDDHIRKESCLHEQTWYQLCSVLLLLSLSDDTQDLDENLLQQTNE